MTTTSSATPVSPAARTDQREAQWITDLRKELLRCGGLIPWEEIDKARALIEKK